MTVPPLVWQYSWIAILTMYELCCRLVLCFARLVITVGTLEECNSAFLEGEAPLDREDPMDQDRTDQEVHQDPTDWAVHQDPTDRDPMDLDQNQYVAFSSYNIDFECF